MNHVTQWELPAGLLMHAALNPHFIATFCLFLGVMLLWTVGCGMLLQKLMRLPLVAGYIIAGIFLGPSVLHIAQWPIFSHPLLLGNAALQQYSLVSSDLFIFFVLLLSGSLTVAYLLWMAGYETEIDEIAQVGTAAVTAGVLGAVLPIGIIGAAMYYFYGSSWTLAQAIGLGVIFSATSVSIPVAMLFATNRMHMRSSKATLGAAIIDDILAVILLSLFFIAVQSGILGSSSTMIAQEHNPSLLYALGAMTVTTIVLIGVGYYVLPFLTAWLTYLGYGQIISLCAIAVMLLYFAGAELMGGLAGITGAYFAGFLFKRADPRHYAHKILTPFVQSILLPVFLASIGLQINIRLLQWNDWYIVGVLLVLAIVSKLIACFMATGLSNGLRRTVVPWTIFESYLFGSSMVARGEVGLVVATILYGLQLLTPVQYVIGIVVIVLTTIASPIMLALGFAQEAVDDHVDVYVIGRFELLGTIAVFNALITAIEKHDIAINRVSLADGRQAVLLVEKMIKIIVDPTQGILVEGKKNAINDLFGVIYEDLMSEVQRLERLG